MGSLGSIVHMAFERELEYLNGKLKENPSIVFLFNSMFKDDTLTALLKNVATSNTGDEDENTANTPEPPRRQLRKGLKKFKHLKQHCLPFIAEALQSLEPTLFPECKAEAGQYELFKVALCIDDSTDFIACYYPECKYVDRCLEAFKKRYEKMGKILRNFTKVDIDNKLAGYYKVVGDRTVVCVFSPQKVYDVGFGNAVTIVAPTNINSEAVVSTEGGKKCKVELVSQFKDLGIEFPDLSEPWDLEGFVKVDTQDMLDVTLWETVAPTRVAQAEV